MNHSLEFDGIGKAYPGVQALKDVSFHADSGEILALLGENGAGKSTLLKILSGDIIPDEGFIRINGVEQKFASPFQAIKAGISVIYQERQLVPAMSIAENLFQGDQPKKAFRMIDRRALKAQTQEIIDKFGIPLNADDLVGRLPVAYQQMVEIMKAYRRNSDIIAFDEPTAPLTDTEISILFDLIMQLKAEGKTILYVSHRLPEVFQLTDKIVVLKDGKLVKEFVTKETNTQELILSMVGRDIGDTFSSLRRNTKIGDVLLEMENVYTDSLNNVSLTLKKGEIIGLAGLVGAGRTEVARAIFGADAILSGELKLDGKAVKFTEPKDAILAGVALCPEDRKEEGLILLRSIRENISMPVLDKIKTGLFLDAKKEAVLAESGIKQYDIKTPSINKTARELSGGNQQKVILARWTNREMATKILILDEPTKGIDVGTKAEVYQLICDLAAEGLGVILISSELTEVINISDRIIVMRNGHITGSVMRQDATEADVLALAMLD